jgi:hypothetical protein
MYLPGIGQKTPPKTNKTKPDPDSADDPEASADECKAHYIAALLKHVPKVLKTIRRVLIKSRLFSNRWLPRTTCACADRSGDFLTPSPPGW